jgi:hypothetical protein
VRALTARHRGLIRSLHLLVPAMEKRGITTSNISWCQPRGACGAIVVGSGQSCG